MIGHDNIIISPYGLVVFTIIPKNVLINGICDYVLHDYMIFSTVKI
jgi:hypothetical protein